MLIQKTRKPPKDSSATPHMPPPGATVPHALRPHADQESQLQHKNDKFICFHFRPGQTPDVVFFSNSFGLKCVFVFPKKSSLAAVFAYLLDCMRGPGTDYLEFRSTIDKIRLARSWSRPGPDSLGLRSLIHRVDETGEYFPFAGRCFTAVIRDRDQDRDQDRGRFGFGVKEGPPKPREPPRLPKPRKHPVSLVSHTAGLPELTASRGPRACR